MRWKREPAGKIFISYRRSDARGVAGRLSDTLGEYFGHERVFRDIEDIDGGADFGHVIEGSLSGADAVIVLIGPEWVSTTDGEGKPRLHDPGDWVAAEIGAALEGDVPVYPVLIDDTPMPRPEDLPERLQPLTRRNAVSISDSRWKEDVTRLAKIVAFDIPGSVAERRLGLIRWLIVLMLLAAVAFTTTSVVINALDLMQEHRADLDAAARLAGQDRLLAAGASAVNFVAILASAILLLIAAPMIDESRRAWAYGAAGIGIAGAFVGLVAYYRPLEGTTETIGLFLISTIVVTALLAAMNLSGFKAK